MAEFYISYQELEKYVDEAIKATEDCDSLMAHKSEILAGLTGDYEQNESAANEMVSLWENQISNPSSLVVGQKYILIESGMLEFLKLAITSGVLELIITAATSGSPIGISITMAGSIAFSVWDFFNSIKSLNDWDFCVYKQVVKNSDIHEEFSEEDLQRWMPTEDNPQCNINDDSWDCDYKDSEDRSVCTIMRKEYLKNAIKSLCDKGLISPQKGKHSHTYTFKFKR